MKTSDIENQVRIRINAKGCLSSISDVCFHGGRNEMLFFSVVPDEVNFDSRIYENALEHSAGREHM